MLLRYPVILILEFAKSLNNSRKAKILRLAIYIGWILSAAVLLLFIIHWYYINRSILSFSSNTTLILIVVLTALSHLFSGGIWMISRDYEAATLVLQDWSKTREKGKLRFVFKRIAIYFLFNFLLILFLSYTNFNFELTMNTLIIVSLVFIGLELFSILTIWHLNIKYQDDVGELLEQQTCD